MLEVMMKRLNKEERIVVTSLDIAETFGKAHREIIYSLEGQKDANGKTKHSGLIEQLEQSGELHVGERFYIPAEYEVNNRKYKMYYITRDGFVLLVMGFSGEKAMKYKLSYINQFNNMEKLLREKFVERQKGITVRHIVTDMIKQSNENERMHGHAYSTYTDMIYRTLFGKSAKQIREELGIGKNESLRDYFTQEELKAIQSKEMLVSSLIDCGWGYDQIKQFVGQNVVMIG